MKLKVMRLRTLPVDHEKAKELSEYGNFHKSGSVSGMKKMYYGKYALLLKCGDYIYNVTANPVLYYLGY